MTESSAMCGIALVVSGIRIECSCQPTDPVCTSSDTEQLWFLADDIKAALHRRGPDSVGEKKVLLKPKVSNSDHEPKVVSFCEGNDAAVRKGLYFNQNGDNTPLGNGDMLKADNSLCLSESVAELLFIGATLQLRGAKPISQPLVGSSGNLLVYNGEIFGGILVGPDDNDAEVLMGFLEDSNNKMEKKSVPDVLSTIKGPWSIIYWQESSKTLWFGRDAFGRRSLLVHWPTSEDPRFLLSSVSPISSTMKTSGSDVENGNKRFEFWEELPCGIYSMSLHITKSDSSLVGEVNKHDWKNTMLKELIEWERVSVEPRVEDLFFPKSGNLGRKLDSHASSGSVQAVLSALRESVMRRTILYRIYQEAKEIAPVAVLFSGGLDSMILAALLDQCLDPKCEIDLLNVSFDGQSAPDRISAQAGMKELKRIAPLRRWNLVEIDAALSELDSVTKHVVSLINPASTYMDLNIGIALWLAASGDGWVDDDFSSRSRTNGNNRVKYRSNARILLVGAGADEQCAGYGRHKTKYRNGSWLGLHREMKLDMQRIWRRNLGRDDRCISDNGKEARFPFLDEDLIKTLLDLPLWEIADLDQPSGMGDKKILRQVARLLGLHEVATLPKRAIQFGSRIARESNRKNFGSNRAANQASAGSADIYAPWGST